MPQLFGIILTIYIMDLINKNEKLIYQIDKKI